MENLSFCRACLATDDLYSTRDIGLLDFYRQLTNSTFQDSNELFKLCFECLYNLKRSRHFRDKCMRAEIGLNQILTSGEIIQQSTLLMIRTTYQLSSEPWSDMKSNKLSLSDTEVKVDSGGLLQSNTQLGMNLKIEFDGEDSESSEKDVQVKIELERCDFNDEDVSSHGEEYNEDVCRGIGVISGQGDAIDTEIDDETNRTIPASKSGDTHVTNYNQEYISANSMRHMEITTSDMHNSGSKAPVEKPWACDLCPYEAIYKSRLLQHAKIHTGEKTYACNFCDYKSLNKSALTRHFRIHTGEKPYVCDHCPYRTTNKSALNTHSRTHTGERPYACELCSYKTADKSSLTRHSRIHTGDKPYACDICPYKATRKSYLSIHCSKHTGENPPA